MITQEQIDQLKRPLARDDVRTRKGGDGVQLSYVESWHVINRANEVFGFDGWSYEVLSADAIQNASVEKRGKNGTYTNQVCVVRATVRVSALGCMREDIGIGVGEASVYNAASAVELAWKAAVSDAMKRALRTFGHQFGLALYDKDQEFVGASNTAQDLLQTLQALAADEKQLRAWWGQNEQDIAQLHADDRGSVTVAHKARLDAAIAARIERAIDSATKQADLEVLYREARDAKLAPSYLDPIVQRCGARKVALRATAGAAPTNGHAGRSGNVNTNTNGQALSAAGK